MPLAKGVSEKSVQGLCVPEQPGNSCWNSLGAVRRQEVGSSVKGHGCSPTCRHGKHVSRGYAGADLREMCASTKSLGREPDRNWNCAQQMLEEGGLSQTSRNKRGLNKPGEWRGARRKQSSRETSEIVIARPGGSRLKWSLG